MTSHQCRIRKVEPVSREKWLSYCCKSQGVTFFHTPMWAELFIRYNPRVFRNSTRRLIFSDGNEVLLPLVKKRLLFGLHSVVSSMPSSTFGGYLSAVPLDDPHEQLAMKHLNGYSNLIFRENPYAPVQTVFSDEPGYDDPTMVVDLKDGHDAVWKRATAGHRNAVRNAEKSGVEIIEATTINDWMDYSAIYLSSINRWKQRNIYTGVYYDERFFMLVAQLKTPLRKLWLAKVKGEAIAGILCFYWGDHVVVWHGSGLSEYFSYHPNNMLYNHAIMHAANAGFRWFDTNPSGSLKGVYKFKQYLGARPKSSRVFVKYSRSHRLLQTIRDRYRRNST